MFLKVLSEKADPNRLIAMCEIDKVIKQITKELISQRQTGNPSSVGLCEALERAKSVRDLISESPPAEIDWTSIVNMIACIINAISKIQN